MKGFCYCTVLFNLRAEDNMFVPEVKTSMLRGVFGKIFKSFNCANRKEKGCGGCILKNTCIYNYIFEGKLEHQTTKPYVLFSPQIQRIFKKGEILTFNLTLFGKAIQYLPHFIFTFIETGKTGITKNKSKYTLQTVTDNDGKIIFTGGEIIAKVNNNLLNPESNSKKTVNKINLNFITPLRLTNFGDLVVKPPIIKTVKMFHFY